MPHQDQYLLALCEPYDEPGHPVPINAIIVHAKTLLHPAVPQPDGGLIYRCLTEFPERGSGPIVPLSTLTYELDGGRLWDLVGDWESVVEALVVVAKGRGCDAMPLGLPTQSHAILAQGPTSTQSFYLPDGSTEEWGSAERDRELAALAAHVEVFVSQGPFWPGDHLVAPPEEPTVLPYRPWTASEKPDGKRPRWSLFRRQ